MSAVKKSNIMSVGTLAKVACVSAAAFCALPGLAADTAEPAVKGAAPIVRRLSPEQYRHAIADIFGDSIQIGGRFEPDVRYEGLLAVGAAHVSVTNAGFEQYDAIGRNIAEQVINPKQRDVLLPCKPADAKKPDDACAQKFLSTAGRLLYRRALTTEELASRVKIARDSATKISDFYEGLSIALSTLLQSSNFLFVRQDVEPDPNHAGQVRPTGYTKATQLSLFFWNSVPDEELLAAAESGALQTKKGLEQQIDRMLHSPRLEQGVRAFFFDMLGFEEFENLDKDKTIYPKFTADILRDSGEQTLRTIVNVLLTNSGDYRDIFTTRKTFLTESLAAIYRVPFVTKARNGAPTHWDTQEYAENDPRNGILSQISFVALHAHPGRSSPTIRGKALREMLLCQPVPPPPGNVDFTVVQDTNNAKYRTTRDRLEAHRTNPVCAGCHKLIDPMGLALENFDADGSFRLTENNVKINTTGMLDGVAFDDASGLAKAVHDNPNATQCLVRRLYAFSLGRSPTAEEAPVLTYLQNSFAANGYRVPDLMRKIATSDAFFRVEPAQPEQKRADAAVTK